MLLTPPLSSSPFSHSLWEALGNYTHTLRLAWLTQQTFLPAGVAALELRCALFALLPLSLFTLLCTCGGPGKKFFTWIESTQRHKGFILLRIEEHCTVA